MKKPETILTRLKWIAGMADEHCGGVYPPDEIAGAKKRVRAAYREIRAAIAANVSEVTTTSAPPTPPTPPLPPMLVRPVVRAFAERMEYKLSQNEYKGSWKSLSGALCLQRAFDEMIELVGCFNGARESDRSRLAIVDSHLRAAHEALYGASIVPQKEGSEVTGESIDDEAADVANFLMMLVDNCARARARSKKAHSKKARSKKAGR